VSHLLAAAVRVVLATAADPLLAAVVVLCWQPWQGMLAAAVSVMLAACACPARWRLAGGRAGHREEQGGSRLQLKGIPELKMCTDSCNWCHAHATAAAMPSWVSSSLSCAPIMPCCPSSPCRYSAHSWLGLAVLTLLALQYCVAAFAYLTPKLSPSQRRQFSPLHIFLGRAVFVGGIATMAVSCASGGASAVGCSCDAPAHVCMHCCAVSVA